MFFFQKSQNFENIFFFCQKKNAILLVLPIEEISLRPELSSPARCRILGGSPEPDGGWRTEEILVSNIGYNIPSAHSPGFLPT